MMPHDPSVRFSKKKGGKRKSQGAGQSQAAALPRYKEEEETYKTKQAQSTKINSLFPKRSNLNAKRIEKQKNKITQGKT